jgi:deoxyadenosine/deoxycytidine kinase
MIIYVSGPHGAGKSSLIKSVCAYTGAAYYPDRLKFAHVENPLLRQRAKIAKFFQEYCDLQNFERENPGKDIIADRCIYDLIAYDNAFEQLGWISKDEGKRNHETIQNLFAPEDSMMPSMPQNVAILNPPFETLVEHLQKRWKTAQKKWREEDFEYLKEVHKAYRLLPEFYYIENLLVIETNTTLEEEVEMFMRWRSKINEDEPCTRPKHF